MAKSWVPGRKVWTERCCYAWHTGRRCAGVKPPLRSAAAMNVSLQSWNGLGRLLHFLTTIFANFAGSRDGDSELRREGVGTTGRY